MTPAATTYDELPEWAKELLWKYGPYCTRWGTRIPSLKGPYGGGWTAHDSCFPHDHGLFIPLPDPAAPPPSEPTEEPGSTEK